MSVGYRVKERGKGFDMGYRVKERGKGFDMG